MMWNQVKSYAKTIAAFVFGVVANMLVNLSTTGTVWPQTQAEWVQYVLTSFGTALAVLLTRNKITDKQIERDPTVARVEPSISDLPTGTPLDGVRNQIDPPTGGYTNPYR